MSFESLAADESFSGFTFVQEDSPSQPGDLDFVQYINWDDTLDGCSASNWGDEDTPDALDAHQKLLSDIWKSNYQRIDAIPGSMFSPMPMDIIAPSALTNLADLEDLSIEQNQT